LGVEMIRIKESTSHRPVHSSNDAVEYTLNRVDTLGRKGMDLFEEHNIKFVYGNAEADFGISKHGNTVSCVPKSKCILLKKEPPIYNVFFGWNISKDSFMKKYMAVMTNSICGDLPQIHHLTTQQAFEHLKYFDTPKTKLLCMVMQNKKWAYRLNKMIPGLRKYNKFSNMNIKIKADNVFCDYLETKYESYGYGKGWNPKCFKGSIPKYEDKYKYISQFTFNFCPENSQFKGYVTEKPIVSMVCGSIPIYIGAPDIYDYLPRGTFIDYRHFTAEELVHHIRDMQPKEINKTKRRIKRFITSREVIDRYSSVAFAKKIIKVIENGRNK